MAKRRHGPPLRFKRPTRHYTEERWRCVRCGNTWKKVRGVTRPQKCRGCKSRHWDWTSSEPPSARGRPLGKMVGSRETEVRVAVWHCMCSWCGFEWKAEGERPGTCPSGRTYGHEKARTPRMQGDRKDWDADRQREMEMIWGQARWRRGMMHTTRNTATHSLRRGVC